MAGGLRREADQLRETGSDALGEFLEAVDAPQPLLGGGVLGGLPLERLGRLVLEPAVCVLDRRREPGRHGSRP